MNGHIPSPGVIGDCILPLLILEDGQVYLHVGSSPCLAPLLVQTDLLKQLEMLEIVVLLDKTELWSLSEPLLRYGDPLPSVCLTLLAACHLCCPPHTWGEPLSFIWLGTPRSEALASCSEYWTSWPLATPDGWQVTWCRQGWPHPLVSPWFSIAACTTALWPSQTVRAVTSTAVGLPIKVTSPDNQKAASAPPHRRALHLKIVCQRIGQHVLVPGQLLQWGLHSC